MKKFIQRISNKINRLIERPILVSIYQYPHLNTLGSEYGGWVVPTDLFNENSICYCVGAGEDISFDIELAKQFSAEVHIFDPTPRAKEHFQKLVQNTRTEKDTIFSGGVYHLSPSNLNCIYFHDIGIYDENKTIKFYAPQNQEHVSYSIENLQKTQNYFSARVKNIKSVMTELGHQYLDLLKIDIEGAEYKVIESIINDKLDIKVLCIEFDESVNKNIDKNYQERISNSLKALECYGYKIVDKNDNDNFTLVHKSVIYNEDY